MYVTLHLRIPNKVCVEPLSIIGTLEEHRLRSCGARFAPVNPATFITVNFHNILCSNTEPCLACHLTACDRCRWRIPAHDRVLTENVDPTPYVHLFENFPWHVEMLTPPHWSRYESEVVCRSISFPSRSLINLNLPFDSRYISTYHRQVNI